MTTLRQVSKKVNEIRDQNICRLVLNGTFSAKKAAARFNLTTSTIYVIMHRQRMKEAERKSK